MPLSGLNSKVVKNGDPEPAPLEPGKFRIYNMRFCPWAQRALIYAAKKQIPAEVVNIHLKDKPDWYFSKHYKGQVPALEHDGKVVIESGHIPEYLDDLLPNTRILPSDPFLKVSQKLMLERLAAIAPAFYGVATSVSDPNVLGEKVAGLVKALEDAQTLLEGPFYSGNAPGYIDYLIFPHFQRIFWLSRLIPNSPIDSAHFPGESKFPKLTKWYSSMVALPEIIESSQSDENGIGFFKGYMQGNPNYDYGI